MAYDIGIKTVSLDRFQVVQRKYFSRLTEPMMTIWESAVAFNTASHDALNNCECIEIYVNEKAKSIAIMPVPSKDKEAVQWIRGSKKYKYNRIECTMFARQIFKSWGLDPQYHYRTPGKLVQCDKKLMILFDFSHYEVWSGSKMVKENG